MLDIFSSFFSESSIIARVGAAAEIKHHKLRILLSMIQLGRDINQNEISRSKTLEPNDCYNKIQATPRSGELVWVGIFRKGLSARR